MKEWTEKSGNFKHPASVPGSFHRWKVFEKTIENKNVSHTPGESGVRKARGNLPSSKTLWETG
jgi:hypothetical protein